MQIKQAAFLALVLMVIASMATAAVAPKGVWNFDGNLNSASGGSALTFGGAGATKASFGTCASFGIAALPGSTAKQVMKYNPFLGGANECVQVNANLAANGGGTKVNQYTIVMDYLPGAGDRGWTTIYDAEPIPSQDADGEGDFFFSNGDATWGLAAMGGYCGAGKYTAGTWVRLALVVDCIAKKTHVYLNGELVGILTFDTTKMTNSGVDGDFALTAGNGPNFSLFANPYDGWSGDGYVSSVAVYDSLLSKGTIINLGGPSADGIPASTPAGPYIWESNFNQPGSAYSNQYDPIKLEEISRGWVKWHPGDAATMLSTPQYGWVDYLGNNKLTLMHASSNWDDTYVEMDLPTDLDASSNLEICVDLVPFFDATANTSQRIVVGVADATTNPDEGNLHLLPAPEVSMTLQQANDGSGNLLASFNGGAQASLGKTSAQINSLKLYLVYEAASTTWTGYYQVGGDVVNACAGSLVAARTKGTVRIGMDTSYVNGGVYKPFYVQLDNYKVLNVKEAFVPVELSTFSAE